MPEIRLFGSLRMRAGVSRVQVTGCTVRETLQALCDIHPALHAMIFNGEHLNSFVRITIQGRDVSLREGLETVVGEADTISLFPPIAGG